MEYRFSLTARLVTLGVVGLVALMVLLFALGYVIGQRLAPQGEREGAAPPVAALPAGVAK